MRSPPHLGNSSLTVAHPPITRSASASIQATAPDFIPSTRRSSSGQYGGSAPSNMEIQTNSEHIKKVNKVHHQPSKSGPIPESEISKLQVETGIAGPSRLPSRVSQQMLAASKSPTTSVTEVPHTQDVLPGKSQIGSVNPHTQACDQNTSGRTTSGHLSDQPSSVAQAQDRQKKKEVEQKPNNGWSHSRNDPIHGPIRQHHQQPRSNSSTSTRQVSDRDSSSYHCPNARKEGPQAVWEPCKCVACDTKNRSIRARIGTDISPKRHRALEDYLRRFGSFHLPPRHYQKLTLSSTFW